MEIPYYLKIGRASDLKDPKERKIYRALEILPGALSWLTLIGVVVLSWLKPFWIAIFIICFIVYWFSRTLYFSFHMSASYKQMKRNIKTDWLEKLNQLPDAKWKNIYHLVVYPTYKESIDILRDAFRSLEKSDWPKEKMIIVLTYEERGGEMAEKVAQTIKKEFADKFFRLFVTRHPSGLSGEIAGKGSNETWGVKQVKEKVIDPFKIPYENIIISAFDADTVVLPKYFSCLAYYYLTADSPLQTSFQPIPLFINNIWQANPISRIFAFSASFWEMICLERPEKLITFSSHSMSFKALVEIGFQQVNVVSEDSRIFWQGFLRYSGDYHVQPIYYPVSMDANVASTFFQTMKNVYKQIRRWAYGVENVPYYLFGFWKDKKIPLGKKFSLGLTTFESYFSWATAPIMIFLLGWLPVVLGDDAFKQHIFSYSLPTLMRNILAIGMIGLLGSAFFAILLLPPKPINLGKRKYLILVVEWFLLPFIIIFFTAIPALEAQTRLMLGKYMGFWATPKVRK